MDVVIRFDTPKPESLLYLLEEMYDDPFVGVTIDHPLSKAEWVANKLKYVQERYDQNIISTVAYVGSGIVGIAFSRPVGLIQGKCSNLKLGSDYWKMGNFYVLKEYRGKGIGKASLKAFVERMKGRVSYFAEIQNETSNALAVSAGLTLTHKFQQLLYSNEIRVLPLDGSIVRSPSRVYNVYFAEIPSDDELENPAIMKK